MNIQKQHTKSWPWHTLWLHFGTSIGNLFFASPKLQGSDPQSLDQVSGHPRD